jgi:predicted nucleic acid-binding protein
VGSLGVLKEAKNRGLIAQVKPMLDEFVAAGIYIGDVLQEIIIRDVGEA